MIDKITARFNSLPPSARFKVRFATAGHQSAGAFSLDYSHKWPRSQALLMPDTPQAGLVSIEPVLVKWPGVFHSVDFRLS
jgi:hypothetical protein